LVYTLLSWPDGSEGRAGASTVSCGDETTYKWGSQTYKRRCTVQRRPRWGMATHLGLVNRALRPTRRSQSSDTGFPTGGRSCNSLVGSSFWQVGHQRRGGFLWRLRGRLFRFTGNGNDGGAGCDLDKGHGAGGEKSDGGRT